MYAHALLRRDVARFDMRGSRVFEVFGDAGGTEVILLDGGRS